MASGSAVAIPPISMVVPTRNRAHTLRKVAHSYLRQEGVTQVIFVEDAGSDDTKALIDALSRAYPQVDIRHVRTPERRGASQCRNIGMGLVTADLVLFCDDDEYLEPGYARICAEKLLAVPGIGAVSGRRIYMRPGETPEGAVARFGNGMRPGPPYLKLLCEHVAAAKFRGDKTMPFTTAVIVTPSALVRRFGFDAAYAAGNGYREESDYQMALYVNGYTNIMTSDTHSLHLPMAEVRTGGQRVNRWQRVRWSVHYTRYFYGKYWTAYARRAGVRTPRVAALAAFAVFSAYREFLRPTLHRMVFALIRVGKARRERRTA